ncbi:MAG: protein kinase domain-containing protein [Gemmatimonadales bacterium]
MDLDRVGVYKLVRLIGSGGMGSVYEAIREGDGFQHRVALKLIRLGMDSDSALQRFRQERQILARLQHPNIATLLDGGTTDDGRPYVVIEYVEGMPLLEYCDRHQLGVRARIALLRQVAAAVQAAHGSLVVHRDLKPGNILVTAAGDVKLLDFGIAKLLDDQTDSSTLTDAGTRLYTPEYASPELILGAPVSVAVDVYALGVICFELLTGTRPFLRDKHSMAALDEPPRPSSAVSADAAALRGDSVAGLRRQLTGDLDQLILQAIHSDPARRYQSVAALDDDLRRYLEGLPVAAQPDRWSYRTRKFVGRHRAGVAISAAVAIALVSAIAVTMWQASQANAAAVLAEQERSRTEAVNRFVVEMLAAQQPDTDDTNVTVVEVLDRAAHDAQRQLAREPELERDVRATLGQTYLSLGKYDAARREFARALELAQARDAALGVVSSDDAIAARNNIGTVLQQAGDWRGADSVWREVVADLQRQNRRDTLYASVLGNLGTAESQLGRLAEGEARQREGVRIWRTLPGDHTTELVTALNNLGVSIGRQQRWAAAESLHREAYAIAAARLGRHHVLTAAALNGMAGALDLQDRLAEADTAYREVLAIRRELLGADHPEYLFTLFNFAAFLTVRDQCGEAITVAREVLSNRGGTLAETHPAVAGSLQTVGRCLDRFPDGDRSEAGRVLLESLKLRRSYLPEGHWLVRMSESYYGEHLGLVGRYREGEPFVVGAYQALAEQFGAESPRTVDALARVVALYERADRPDRVRYYQSLQARPR